jgi:hypothetical protein
VIWDSQPWKRELARLARQLSDVRRRASFEDGDDFRVERAIVLGFFAVRRLHEAHKVTDATMEASVAVTRFQQVKRIPDHWSWHRVDEHYELTKGRAQRLPLKTFYNQAIHSFVFVPGSLPGSRSLGLYLASDRERKRSLLHVRLLDIERAFLRVSKDVVTEGHYVRRSDNPSEYDITLK